MWVCLLVDSGVYEGEERKQGAKGAKRNLLAKPAAAAAGRFAGRWRRSSVYGSDVDQLYQTAKGTPRAFCIT